MSQNKPTPSFNTVKKSNRQKRHERLKFSRILLLAIFAVTALLLLTSLIFAVCLIFDGSDSDDNTPTLPPFNQGIGDQLQYERITQTREAVHGGVLINVNAQHIFDFQNKLNLKNIEANRQKYQDEFDTYGVVEHTWQMDADALAAFNEMMLTYYEAFGEEDHIWITSAWRSFDDQLQGNYDLLPGYSDHHTGLCVAIKAGDANGDNRHELASDHWIYQNCYRFGFVIRYPAHKTAATGVENYEFCLRYVGTAHAAYMTEHDLCLEEYTKLLSDSATKDAPIRIDDATGKQYLVYYVKAEKDVTTLDVPKNYTYKISGDNVAGFIVTVCLSETRNA